MILTKENEFTEISLPGVGNFATNDRPVTTFSGRRTFLYAN